MMWCACAGIGGWISCSPVGVVVAKHLRVEVDAVIRLVVEVCWGTGATRGGADCVRVRIPLRLDGRRQPCGGATSTCHKRNL